VNREKVLLSHLLTNARQQRGIVAGANPCAGIRGFAERVRSRYVSDENLKAILAKAGTPLAACLRIGHQHANGRRPAQRKPPAVVLGIERRKVPTGPCY